MKTITELQAEIKQIEAQANLEIGKRMGQIELLEEYEKEKATKKDLESKEKAPRP